MTRLQEQLRYPSSANGIAVVVGGSLVCIDLFDKPSTLEKTWQGLREGFLLDLLEAGGAGRKASETEIRAGLDRLRHLAWRQVEPVGLGERYRAGDGGIARRRPLPRRRDDPPRRLASRLTRGCGSVRPYKENVDNDVARRSLTVEPARRRQGELKQERKFDVALHEKRTSERRAEPFARNFSSSMPRLREEIDSFVALLDEVAGRRHEIQEAVEGTTVSSSWRSEPSSPRRSPA